MEATTETAATDLTRAQNYLHRLINNAKSVALLQAIATILTGEELTMPLADDTLGLEDLPPAERAAVERGLQQSEAGQGIPHAQVWAKYEATYGVKCDL
ncbi:MAG: hypothetical protein ACRYFX_02415 [Janthinobacterium lividum]